MAYIYVITNQLNGKQYVGKTLKNPTQRFKEHCRDSKKERCENYGKEFQIKSYRRYDKTRCCGN